MNDAAIKHFVLMFAENEVIIPFDVIEELDKFKTATDDLGRNARTVDGQVVLEPLTYIRGRSIPNQYMIVDEAQNLTPHEVKTIASRVREGPNSC